MPAAPEPTTIVDIMRKFLDGSVFSRVYFGLAVILLLYATKVILSAICRAIKVSWLAISSKNRHAIIKLCKMTVAHILTILFIVVALLGICGALAGIFWLVGFAAEKIMLPYL